MDDLLRYVRNQGAISPEEQRLLEEKRAVVIGLGGLGGYIVEYLGRLGIGHMTLADGDVLEASNLNRQLLATETQLGMPKTEAARRRLAEVNPRVSVQLVNARLTGENADAILAGHHVILDALDNIPDRLLLEQAASRLGIPLVHGAISGWCGQFCTVLPGDNALSRLYEGAPSSGTGSETASGSLSFTAAMVAALQASEAVKVLLGRGGLMRGRLCQVDLLQGSIQQIGCE